MLPLLPAVQRPAHTTTGDVVLDSLHAIEQAQDFPFLVQIDTVLSDIAQDIINLSNTIQSAMALFLPLDPERLDQDAIFIQQSLLACEISGPSQLNHAFRIAALIYVKSLTRPVAAIAQTSQILAAKLQAQIILADAPSTPFLNWMHFIGFMASAKNSIERVWFLRGLGDRDWVDLRGELKQVLWVSEVHDEFGEALWLER
jgi:hypothetical protein